MKMPLSIDENSKIHSDEKISVLLNSKKKHYYLTFFEIDYFGQNYLKVLQHFKSSVRDITYIRCRWNPFILCDALTLFNLLKLASLMKSFLTVC
jgi:hypothetical protein